MVDADNLIALPVGFQFATVNGVHHYVQARPDEARHFFGRVVLLHEIDMGVIVPVVPRMPLKDNMLLELLYIGKADVRADIGGVELRLNIV